MTRPVLLIIDMINTFEFEGAASLLRDGWEAGVRASRGLRP